MNLLLQIDHMFSNGVYWLYQSKLMFVFLLYYLDQQLLNIPYLLHLLFTWYSIIDIKFDKVDDIKLIKLKCQ